MKIKLLFILTLTPFLFLSSAFARLGETEAQIGARYGKVISTEKNGEAVFNTYSYSGFNVTVGFLNGHSEYESYVKQTKEVFTISEVQEILDKNKFNSGGWGEPYWVTEDGKLAQLRPDGSIMVDGHHVAKGGKYGMTTELNWGGSIVPDNPSGILATVHFEDSGGIGDKNVLTISTKAFQDFLDTWKKQHKPMQGF